MSKMIGERWWNPALPVDAPAVKIVGITVAAILSTGLLYPDVEPVLRACLWNIAHHSHASVGGLDVKVPRMWRQEETPAGRHELQLVRARLGEPVEFESIVISEGQGSSPELQTANERLRVLAGKLGFGEFRGTSLSLDPRFTCVAPHFAKLQTWQISCLSIDNGWSANLYGTAADIDSLRLVLRGMSWRVSVHWSLDCCGPEVD